MATVLGSLLLKLTGDTADARQAIDQVEKKAKGFSKFIKGAMGIGGAIIAFKMLSRVSRDLTEAYAVQETAETTLRSAITATGKEGSISAEKLFDYASELQRVTTYGDEATISAMALLQSLANLSEEGIKQIMPLVQDLAAGMRIDLESAASLVGKTLGSTTNALSRYGIEIDATAPKEEKLAQLAEEMQKKFGGLSRQLAETTIGTVKQLQNAIGDLKEEGGKAILEFAQPAVQRILEFTTKTIEAIEKVNAFRKALKDLKIISEEGTDAIKDKAKAIEGLNDYHDTLSERIKVLEEQEKNWLNRALGAVKGIKEKREQIQEEQKAVEESIRLLEEEIEAEKERQKMSAQEREEAEKRLKAEEEKNYWTNERIRIQTKLIQQFAVIEEMEKLWGDNIDVTGEKQKALNAALQEMIDLGFTAGGPGIQKILAMFSQWLEGAEEVEDKVIPILDEYGRVIEQAAINVDNLAGMEVRARGTFRNTTELIKEQAEETMKLSGALDFAGMALSTLGDLYSQYYENLYQQLENEYEARKTAIEANIADEETRSQALTELDNEFEERRKVIAREEAKRSRNIAVFESIISTANAVMSALATVKPTIPWGIAASILVGALGAAKTAMIAAQPLPAFAAGADFIVPPGYPNDSYIFRAESGEHVKVTPPEKAAPSSMFHVSIYFAGRHFYDEIHRASADGSLVIHPRSVRP